MVVCVLLQEVLLRSLWQLAKQENCMRSGWSLGMAAFAVLSSEKVLH